MLNERTRSGLLALAFCTSMASAADFSPDARLTLVIPGQEPTLKCTPITAARRNAGIVIVQQSFLEPFDTLDLSKQRWLPHYDGGYDTITKTWLGYDWGVAKRTLQGTGEQELYVDAGYRGTAPKPLGLDPFRVRDGVLSIVAQRTPADLRPFLFGYEFISGALTSRASFVQRYGYFEMRARIPKGKALWPAFWLLPADKSWPPEIDILEVVGQQADLMVTTTHWTGTDGKRQASGCRTSLPTASSAFHLFGVLWMPERIVYYIDREPVAQLATPPGVDKPMYLLLNLAVGGNMVGRADDETPLPASYDIDWVSAYALPGHAPCEPRRSAAEVNRCDPPK